MNEFEAFEILFQRLSVWRMVEIYNNHFPDDTIYSLTTSNINKIFANHTPYYLLQQFSTNIDIKDEWLIKDKWALTDEWYSFSDEETVSYIMDEVYALYEDSSCWRYIIDSSDIKSELSISIAQRIKEHFNFYNIDIALYYVSELKLWEFERDEEYNFQKFSRLYRTIKEKYMNYRPNYATDILDEVDFWHYENQFLQNGYIKVDY